MPWVLRWSDGMLYPVLHRLERDGLIAGRWELTDEGRRRKYYRLTARGKQQLSSDRESWRAVHGALEMSWGGSHAMVVLPILLALLAAPFDSAASQAPTIAIDSTGVEVVTSDPLGSDATCTLGEEPIFRVGESEDEEEEWFSYVRGVARLSDGSVAVVDRTSAEVRIFDQTGIGTCVPWVVPARVPVNSGIPGSSGSSRATHSGSATIAPGATTCLRRMENGCGPFQCGPRIRIRPGAEACSTTGIR